MKGNTCELNFKYVWQSGKNYSHSELLTFSTLTYMYIVTAVENYRLPKLFLLAFVSESEVLAC